MADPYTGFYWNPEVIIYEKYVKGLQILYLGKDAEAAFGGG
jgi:hypothetical protein